MCFIILFVMKLFICLFFVWKYLNTNVLLYFFMKVTWIKSNNNMIFPGSSPWEFLKILIFCVFCVGIPWKYVLLYFRFMKITLIKINNIKLWFWMRPNVNVLGPSPWEFLEIHIFVFFVEIHFKHIFYYICFLWI